MEIFLTDSKVGNELYEREDWRAHGFKASHTSAIRRIEGGMLSYHADMTINTNPFELGIQFIDLNNEFVFIGKDALIKIKKMVLKESKLDCI